VLLISRTESKLVAAAEEVAKKYNVQTKYSVVDFANADEATWQRTTTALASLDVGLLINNVGLSYDHCEYFEHLSDQDVRNMVEVNITSVNQVSSQTQKLHSTASKPCKRCCETASQLVLRSRIVALVKSPPSE